MSRQGFCAISDKNMPALEVMEPRLLLSAVPTGLSVDELIELAPSISLHADTVPGITKDDQSVLRSDLRDTITAIADLKARSPSADASLLPDLGIATVSQTGDIRVTVRFDSGQAGVQAALTETGFHAVSIRQDSGIASGWVSYANAYALGEISGVKEVSLPIPVVTNAGSITTAGDGLLNVDDLRSLLSVDGTGVKIGVISDGVYNWQDVRSSGDLPMSITIDPSLPGTAGANEGTAMLEIIHDLAPGADLYFSGPAYTTDIADSIDGSSRKAVT